MSIDSINVRLRDILAPLLAEPGPYVLAGVPFHPNVGDHALWLGTLELLRRNGVELALTGSMRTPIEEYLDALDGAGTILFAGGGNFGDIWEGEQLFRERLITTAPDARVIQLPQSCNFRDPAGAARARAVYETHGNVTLLMRDEHSTEIAAELFPSATTTLTPDLAFALGLRGSLRNAALPDLPIFWLTRNDPETTWRDFSAPRDIPREDWTKCTTMDSETILRGGLADVQRGRLLVTEKLHGHVLALLTSQPHVILGDRYGKIRGLYDAWSRGNPLARWANSPGEAVRIAREWVTRL